MQRLALTAVIAALVAINAYARPASAQAAPEPAAVTAGTPASPLPRTSHLYANRSGQELYFDLIVDDSVKVTGKRPAIQKLVVERQQLSIHTVENGKVPKIFQNAAQLLPKPAN